MSTYISLLFEVERPDGRVPGREVKLYANHIEVSSSLVIPYQSLVDTFKFLYGNDIVCHFRLKSIEYNNK